MDALVVYESMFGNTRDVARAIAEGLGTRLTVRTCEVGEAPAVVDDTIGLLVAGGPTHAFGMSRPTTRHSAAEQAGGALVSLGNGVREWLAGLPGTSVPAAAFDTRVGHPRVPGSAAHAVGRRLRRLGCRMVVPAETFWVEGTPGPVMPGELDRARSWGERLATVVAVPAGTVR
jgi:hypothetical protein